MNTFVRRIPIVGSPDTRTRRLHVWVRDTCARHPWAGALVVAFVFLGVAGATALHYGLPMRDPVGYYRLLVLPLMLIAGFIFVDIAFRSIVAHRRSRVPWREALRDTAAMRATPGRVVPIFAGFLAFQITYIAYRNLKSFLPIVRFETYDQVLMDVDRYLFFGAAPAELLHALLGTGWVAHVLAWVYVFFLLFVPLSVAFALVVGHIRDGMWYITALIWNWILGTASYYVLPALGPAFIETNMFSALPVNSASQLQTWLEESRAKYAFDTYGFLPTEVSLPVVSSTIQGVAAFASLHTSIVFTAYLAARILGMRRLSWVLMVFLVLTAIATIYFGWHYVTDDIAGLLIGAAAIVLASWTTGKRGRGFTPVERPAVGAVASAR